MRRAPSQVHAAAGEFDEEQYVQALQPNSINSKEINRDHARRLRAEELAPRGTPPLSRRPELLPAQADSVRRRIASLGIAEVVFSPLSPCQSPYVERLIRSAYLIATPRQPLDDPRQTAGDLGEDMRMAFWRTTVTRGRRQLRSRNPHRRLPIAFSFAHRHGRMCS